MNKLKKFVVLFMILCLLFPFAMFFASAEADDSYYEIKEDGTVKITKYNDTFKTQNLYGNLILVIPDTIDGKKVTEIADNANISLVNYYTLRIPEGVEIIGANAFYMNDGYDTFYLYLPSTLKRIGDKNFNGICRMFLNCNFTRRKLERLDFNPNSNFNLINYESASFITLTLSEDEVTPFLEYTVKDDGTVKITGPKDAEIFDVISGLLLPSVIDGRTVTEIGDNAFYKEDYNIRLPETLKIIGSYAFTEGKIYSPLNLPNIEEIGESAFSGVRFGTIKFGPNLKSVGYSAFDYTYTSAKLEYMSTYEDWKNVNIEGRNARLFFTSFTYEVDTQNIPYTCEHINDYEYVSTKAPACMEYGYDLYRCGTCRAEAKDYDNSKPAPGHIISDLYQYTQNQTCHSPGYKVIRCKTCRKSKTDLYIEPYYDNHDIETAVIKPATCSEYGRSKRYCVNEGCTYSKEYTTYQFHSYKFVYEAKPTLGIDGYKEYTCTLCGTDYKETISKLSHDILVEKNRIQGVNAGMTTEELLDKFNAVSGVSFTVTPKKGNRIGTGSTVKTKYSNGTVLTYDVLLYGDVDGDGWYDGTDAVLVNMIAGGMLTKEQVGEAVWTAADCNHDGVIDSSDVLLLEQAGLLLANVDQTKSAEELKTDSAFAEYLSIIDQTPNDESTLDDGQTTLFDMIISFLKELLNAIINFVGKMI